MVQDMDTLILAIERAFDDMALVDALGKRGAEEIEQDDGDIEQRDVVKIAQLRAERLARALLRPAGQTEKWNRKFGDMGIPLVSDRTQPHYKMFLPQFYGVIELNRPTTGRWTRSLPVGRRGQVPKSTWDWYTSVLLPEMVLGWDIESIKSQQQAFLWNVPGETVKNRLIPSVVLTHKWTKNVINMFRSEPIDDEMSQLQLGRVLELAGFGARDKARPFLEALIRFTETLEAIQKRMVGEQIAINALFAKDDVLDAPDLAQRVRALVESGTGTLDDLVDGLEALGEQPGVRRRYVAMSRGAIQDRDIEKLMQMRLDEFGEGGWHLFAFHWLAPQKLLDFSLVRNNTRFVPRTFTKETPFGDETIKGYDLYVSLGTGRYAPPRPPSQVFERDRARFKNLASVNITYEFDQSVDEPEGENRATRQRLQSVRMETDIDEFVDALIDQAGQHEGRTRPAELCVRVQGQSEAVPTNQARPKMFVSRESIALQLSAVRFLHAMLTIPVSDDIVEDDGSVFLLPRKLQDGGIELVVAEESERKQGRKPAKISARDIQFVQSFPENGANRRLIETAFAELQNLVFDESIGTKVLVTSLKRVKTKGGLLNIDVQSIKRAVRHVEFFSEVGRLRISFPMMEKGIRVSDFKKLDSLFYESAQSTMPEMSSSMQYVHLRLPNVRNETMEKKKTAFGMNLVSLGLSNMPFLRALPFVKGEGRGGASAKPNNIRSLFLDELPSWSIDQFMALYASSPVNANLVEITLGFNDMALRESRGVGRLEEKLVRLREIGTWISGSAEFDVPNAGRFSFRIGTHPSQTENGIVVNERRLVGNEKSAGVPRQFTTITDEVVDASGGGRFYRDSIVPEELRDWPSPPDTISMRHDFLFHEGYKSVSRVVTAKAPRRVLPVSEFVEYIPASTKADKNQQHTYADRLWALAHRAGLDALATVDKYYFIGTFRTSMTNVVIPRTAPASQVSVRMLQEARENSPSPMTEEEFAELATEQFVFEQMAIIAQQFNSRLIGDEEGERVFESMRQRMNFTISALENVAKEGSAVPHMRRFLLLLSAIDPLFSDNTPVSFKSLSSFVFANDLLSQSVEKNRTPPFFLVENRKFTYPPRSKTDNMKKVVIVISDSYENARAEQKYRIDDVVFDNSDDPQFEISRIVSIVRLMHEVVANHGSKNIIRIDEDEKRWLFGLIKGIIEEGAF